MYRKIWVNLMSIIAMGLIILEIGKACDFSTRCCSEYSCINGSCQKTCKSVGEACGFGVGTCCSDSSCYGVTGVCQKNCRDAGQECGFTTKCCSETSCISGTCQKTCKDVGQACGFGVGVCCTDSSCYDGVCKKNCITGTVRPLDVAI